MNLSKISIANFGSFKDTQTFNFKKSGFYFLQGENRQEERLGANGAGKSTLFNALCWLLYGRTLSGLKAGDVVNWEAGKNVEVCLRYEHDGVGYKAVRTWKPNTWKLSYSDQTVDLVEDETNLLWAHLRVGYQAAAYSIFMAQGRPMFLDLSAKDKSSLFSEIMNLDRWLAYSDKASKMSASYADKAYNVEKEIARIEGEIKGLLAIDLTKDSEAWETARKYKMERLEDDYQITLDYAKKLKKDIGELKTTLDSFNRAVSLTSKKMSMCLACNQPIRNTGYDDAIDGVRRTQLALGSKARDLKGVEKQLDGIEVEVEKKDKERNPFAGQVDDIKDKVENLQHKMISCRDRLEDAQYKQKLYLYWVQGFKDLRLKLIAGALQQLEIETNSSLVALGLVGWNLRFAVDRENKAGNLTRGFTVKVESPHNEGLVAWESWSGGEAQRLRLAAAMGLSNLIRGATGCTLDLEVWDEPTSHLDAGGIDDLLGCLRDRASGDQRQIWIVDHRSLGYSGFDGISTVVKSIDGSVIKGE